MLIYEFCTIKRHHVPRVCSTIRLFLVQLSSKWLVAAAVVGDGVYRCHGILFDSNAFNH